MKKLVLIISCLLSLGVSAKGYIGWEGQYRFTSFTHDKLGCINSDVPETTLLGGFYLNDFFSLEGGIHAAKTNRFYVTNVTHQLRGSHLGIVAFAPVGEIKLIYGASLSRLKAVYRFPENKVHFKKVTPRFMCGLQLSPEDLDFDLRISLSMEKISKMRHRHPSLPYVPRDTIIVGSGLFYRF